MWHRRNPSETGEASAEISTNKRYRRDCKGWGPFSGGQLTAIILGITIAIAFPVGAWAVTGSNSFITDATSGAHAKVDGKQNVNTAIHDSVSGVAAKVNSAGQQLVSGSVAVNGTTRQANPVDLYTSMILVNGCALLAPPSGHALVITSVKEVNTDPNGAQEELARMVGGDCNNTSGASFKDVDPSLAPNAANVVNFPSGLVIPDAAELMITGGSTHLWVTVNGYQLPDAYCPTIQSCSLGD
jgi:hypothetical protein